MQTVEDKNGDTWQVAVSKESYGTLFLLFCRTQDNVCRRYMVTEETLLSAEQALSNMPRAVLLEKLAAAETFDHRDIN